MKRALRVGVLLGMLVGSVGCGSGATEVGRGDRPVRPSVGDDGTDTGELVFRLADFAFADPSVAPVGRNLDGFETTAQAGTDTQCTAPSGAQPPVDGVGGMDNAFQAELASIIDLVVPCAQADLYAEHLEGRGTLVLRIEGWNGEADDSAVTASLVVAADATSSSLADVMWDSTTHQLVLASDGTTPAAAPEGDAEDSYVARPDSFTEGGTTPRLRDTNAYFADGTLVFAIPERGELVLHAGSISLVMRMTDALILADLAADFSSITSGSLSGRLSLTDFLESAESIGICAAEQESVEAQLQQVLDVNSDPNAAVGGDCDAMSFGFPFTGALATLAASGGVPTLAGSNPPLANACTGGTICQ